MLDREGTPKDVWFDLDYTPAVDERGVLATVSETTARAHGERQRARQEERLAQVNASLDALRVRLEQDNRRLATRGWRRSCWLYRIRRPWRR